MTPKYRGATSIPAKMWKKLVEIAHMYPNPQQFYEKAVALGEQYGIGEKELIAWGTIDPHHKPKTPTVAEAEGEIIRSAAQAPTPSYYEPREQAPPLITEEDIARGHLNREAIHPDAGRVGKKKADTEPPQLKQTLEQEKPHEGWEAIKAKEKADAKRRGERTPETEGASPPNPVSENKKQR